VIEGYLQFFYSIGELASRYDSVSHLSPINLLINSCGVLYATVEVPGCSARYSRSTAVARSRPLSAKPQVKRPALDTTPAATVPARPTPSIRAPGLPHLDLPRVPDLRGGPAAPSESSVRKLLDYLLG
jgi:hypothetical protein